MLQETNRFCGNCGNPLTPQVKYCSRCGMAVEPAFMKSAEPNDRARNLLVSLGIPAAVLGAILILVSLTAIYHGPAPKTAAPNQKMYTSPGAFTCPAEMTAEEKSSAEAAFNEWINDLTNMDHQSFMQKYKSAFTWVPGITSYQVISEKVLNKYELDYTLKVSGTNQGWAFNDKTLSVKVNCKEPEMLYVIHATYSMQQ